MYAKETKIKIFNPGVGLLQPLPIPDKVWDCITMDFIEGLPRRKKCSICGGLQSTHILLL